MSIKTQYAEKILNFWFNNSNVWFNATINDDKQIIKIFSDYKYILTTTLENSDDSNIVLAKIILYDQLMRHMYRNKSEIIKYYLDQIILFVYDAIQENYDKYYEHEKFCFFIMPLRHSNNIKDVKIANELITRRIKETPNNGIYIKCYFHTIKKLSLLNNNEQKIKTNLKLNFIPDIVIKYSVIDKSYLSFNEIWKRKIYNFNQTKKTKITEKICNLIYKEKLKHVCVSLSGGIDSMLILASLIYAKNIKLLDNITAFHINYKNRYKADIEQEYVKRFCKTHNINLIIREITEIKRTSEFREIYENITRIIRFDMYKQINLPIFLGHNLTDCIENMIMNIQKSKHYDNLYQMTEKAIIHDILVYRPLLEFNKNEIYETTKMINLSHTQNSTPTWSERWKIRNKLMVLLNETHPGFITGLTKIRQDLMTNYNYTNQITLDIINKIIVIEESTKRNVLKIPFYDNIFFTEIWKNIIIKICYQQQIQVPSQKSLLNLIKQMQGKKYNRVNLGKNLYIKINENNVILFYNKKIEN